MPYFSFFLSFLIEVAENLSLHRLCWSYCTIPSPWPEDIKTLPLTTLVGWYIEGNIKVYEVWIFLQVLHEAHLSVFAGLQPCLTMRSKACYVRIASESSHSLKIDLMLIQGSSVDSLQLLFKHKFPLRSCFCDSTNKTQIKRKVLNCGKKGAKHCLLVS